MDYVEYGKTGVEVSRLCFGTGHLNNVCNSHAAGGDLLLAALDEGVTFWDTAEMYNSQLHVGNALKRIDRDRVVIQTKSIAKDADAMRASLDKSLTELGTDFIDIYFLHAIESADDLAAREGPLDVLREAKADGKIGVIGCSTHIYAGPVMDAVIDHPDLRIMLSTANKEGRMLEGGPMNAHARHLQRACESGMGVSIMKVLAAGKIPEADREEWIQWGFDFQWAHAVNLGMSNHDEIAFDARIARKNARAERAA